MIDYSTPDSALEDKLTQAIVSGKRNQTAKRKRISRCWLSSSTPYLVVGKREYSLLALVWLRFHGKLPKGRVPTQLCRIDACINPDHLILS